MELPWHYSGAKWSYFGIVTTVNVSVYVEGIIARRNRAANEGKGPCKLGVWTALSFLRLYAKHRAPIRKISCGYTQNSKDLKISVL